MFPMQPVQTIVVAALDGALLSGLIGVLDLLSLAKLGIAKYSTYGQTQIDPWTPTVVTASYDGSPVRDNRGQKFYVDSAFDDIAHCRAIIVPGISPDSRGLFPEVLTRKRTQLWLADQHRRGALVGSSCSGAFALGEAGLLDGRRCTTTWWLHYEFKKRFPSAKALWGNEIVDDGNIVTAGGPLSWTKIALHIIRLLAGIQTASLVADFAVVDTVPKSQNIYVPQDYLIATAPFIIRAEQTVRHTLNRRISTRELASSMAVSERTLHRRLKQLTGEAPKAFIDRLCIDSACTLLQSSSESIATIAESLGFSDETVFRRLFRRHTGMTPTGYRRWFLERSKEQMKMDFEP